MQASPYIIREVLDLEKKLLVPDTGFQPRAMTMPSATSPASLRQMGFSRRRARPRPWPGSAAQRRYQNAPRRRTARRLLQQLRESKQLGVVLFARSYMSQDSGANLGIAEKLAQLGVVPMPLDYLPLDSINVKEYSDRPYWLYESKHIAGAAITAKDPQLYGLILTNFGCGPNSFMLNVVRRHHGRQAAGPTGDR